MSKELKIISTGPAVHQTKVFIGDKQIGLIQKINFIASTEDDAGLFSQVEIVFPDLLSIPSYSDSNGLLKDLKENLELLKDMTNVKVTLQKLTFEDS